MVFENVCPPKTDKKYYREEDVKIEKNCRHNDFSFKKSYRILRSDDFNSIFNKGTKIFLKYHIVFYIYNKIDNPRLGVVVSRKIGKAHYRNRIKRQIRNIFRTSLKNSIKNVDLIIIPKKVGVSINYQNRLNDLKVLINKL